MLSNNEIINYPTTLKKTAFSAGNLFFFCILWSAVHSLSVMVHEWWWLPRNRKLFKWYKLLRKWREAEHNA